MELGRSGTMRAEEGEAITTITKMKGNRNRRFWKRKKRRRAGSSISSSRKALCGFWVINFREIEELDAIEDRYF